MIFINIRTKSVIKQQSLIYTAIKIISGFVIPAVTLHKTYPSLLCDLTGSFRRSGIHQSGKGGHLQDHSFRHAHGKHEVQAEGSRGAGRARRHRGQS